MISKRFNLCIWISLILIIPIFQYGCKEPTDEERLKSYTDSIKQSPNNAYLYKNRSTINARLGRRDSALNDIKRAIALDSNDTECYTMIGVMLSGRGEEETEKSIHYYSKGIEFGNKKLYTLRAISYGYLRQYELAIKDMIEAAKDDPQYDYYDLLGYYCLKVGQFDKAIESYNRYCELQIKKGEIIMAGKRFKDIAMLYSLKGEYEIALTYIEKAIKLDSSSQYYCYKGIALYKIKDYKNAIVNLEKSISLDNKYSLPEYYLCAIYVEINDNKKAVIHLDRLLEKGFWCYEFIFENRILKKLIKTDQFKSSFLEYSKDNKKHKNQEVLENILRRGKIIGLEEMKIVNERIDILFAQPSRRKEFITLNKLEY